HAPGPMPVGCKVVLAFELPPPSYPGTTIRSLFGTRRLTPWQAPRCSCEVSRYSAGADPLFGSRHFHRNIRKENPQGLSISLPLVIGGEEQRPGLLVVLPRRDVNAREAGTGPVVNDFLESLVLADVQLPGIAGRVATLRRELHHHSRRGLLTYRHLVYALIRHARPNIPRDVQRK